MVANRANSLALAFSAWARDSLLRVRPQLVGGECAGVLQVFNARIGRTVVGAVQVGEDVHAVAAHQDEAHEGAEAFGRFAVKVGGLVEGG